VLTRQWSRVLKNRLNLLPLAVILVDVLAVAALYYYGRYYNPQHAHLYQQTILVRPFIKALGSLHLPSPTTLFLYINNTFGVTLLLALLGIMSQFLPKSNRISSSESVDRVRNAFLLTMTVWVLLGSLPLLKLANSVTHGYMVAIPVATLSALFLWRLKPSHALILVIVMAGFQVSAISRGIEQGIDADDRRVLAAAAFLNEERPDLLRKGTIAFLPRNEASNVGQYARGQSALVIMPADFPVEMRLHSVGSKEDVLLDFVNAYNRNGEIKADWLILSSENLSTRTKAFEFYGKLRSDPKMSWIAAFTDRHGRSLWLGEVKPGGTPLERVNSYEVDVLADIYEKKYDRISFLKRNVAYILHY